MNWLISANSSKFDHASVFEHFGFIDWKQGNGKFQKDDIIYIYSTVPIKKIQYKCRVDKINLNSSEIQLNEEYWFDKVEYKKALNGKYMRVSLLEHISVDSMSLENLMLNGLKAAPQGSKKLEGSLLRYIESNFDNPNETDFFPELIDKNAITFEGLKKSITVNKYERSSLARSKCIEYHGTNCKVCNINFNDVYGDLGKDFIHIHHIIPIHKIGKIYKVNYKEDLIPVCPNCHAMLHRKVDGKEISVDQLKNIFFRIEKSE